MVKTEIQRHVTAKSTFLRTIEPTVTSLLFKSPERGSRILINGGLTTEDQHVSYKPSQHSFEWG
jgi:hypothetical protein